jgi:hypothetical protein
MQRNLASPRCSALILMSALALAVPLLGQNQQWNPNQPSGQNMGQEQQGDNPLIGSWGSRMQQRDGGTLVAFTEFMPNGHWRITSIAQGGMSNGMRTQMWGTYTIRKTGQNRYVLSEHFDGVAPRRMCVQGGSCQDIPAPGDGKDFDEVIDQNHVHVHSVSVANGNFVDVDAERAPVPPQLQTELPETLTMAAPPPSGGGGGGGGNAPYVPNNGPVHINPAAPIKGLGNNCDDAQQAQVCYMNDHAMYTDSRGCRMCAQ